MNITAAVQTIRDTAEKEIKKLLAEQDKPWEPEDDSWFTTSSGTVVSKAVFQQDYHEMGNAFPTKKAAEQAIARRKAYVFIIREIARVNREKGWVADWEDYHQWKYCLYTRKKKLIHKGSCEDRASHNELYGCSNAIRNIMSNHADTWKIAMGIS